LPNDDGRALPHQRGGPNSPPQREGRQHDANNTSPRKGDKAGGGKPPPPPPPNSPLPLTMGAGSYKETFTDI